MIKSTLLAVILTACLSLATGCGDNKENNNNSEKSEATAQYTCPMHPEVVSDKPGTCPNCDMDLVKKD